MKTIYGPKNCTNLSIKQMTDDRFKVTMVGKLANLGDDIEPEAIDNNQLKVLKNISTADTVTTRKLYSQSESVTFTVKLYFTTNSDIKSFEKGYAYRRRIVWLPMFNKVEKPDPNFISKMTSPEALKYWVKLLVDGYMRLYRNQAWTKCELVENYNKQYHEENDYARQFAEDLNPDVIVGSTMKEMKEAFDEWNDEDYRRLSTKQFKDAVWDLYKIGIGVSKVDGRSRRVFMKQSETKQKLRH
jgi:putative DNA primase/helicase